MLQALTRSEKGFTYIAALVLVVIMGIMMGAVGQSVKVIMKREREKELIFRGLQYRDAIERWNKKNPGKQLSALNTENLYKMLVEGGDSLKREPFLRKPYLDPITRSDFKLVIDPNTKEIQGVVSTSGDEPFKQANFPEVIKSFEGKKKYSEWAFIYKKTPAGAPSAAGTAPAGSTPPISFPLSTPETN